MHSTISSGRGASGSRARLVVMIVDALLKGIVRELVGVVADVVQERLTGALLDRLTHHVSILEMNGDSYRLSQSRARKTR